MSYELWVMGYELWVMGYGLWVAGSYLLFVSQIRPKFFILLLWVMGCRVLPSINFANNRFNSKFIILTSRHFCLNLPDTDSYLDLQIY